MTGNDLHLEPDAADGPVIDREVVQLAELGRQHVRLAGGKGAQLGELLRIDGVEVPAGFVVTRRSYDLAASAPDVDVLLDRLGAIGLDDAGGLRDVASQIRRALEAAEIPDALAAAVTSSVAAVGAEVAWAVRSSATAEDGDLASFAGQHDSYLGVVGAEAVLEQVRRCWASMFTDRAISYRKANGIGHRDVGMAVVVQQLVAAQASGVLFTADPATGHRKTAVIEAVHGLGENLVAGLVTADSFKVVDGSITHHAAAANGHLGGLPALTDEQLVELAAIGRRIERHFGVPQDIEWCRAGDGFWIVQSRPITTLFPIPESDQPGNRVFVSVGHQQMMTDAMRPLGLSVWQHTSPAPMRVAGSRLFIDVTEPLASPATRPGLLRGLGGSDPLLGDALTILVDRGDFLPEPSGPAPTPPPGSVTEPINIEPTIVPKLIARAEASLTRLEADLDGRAGVDLLDAIEDDLQHDLREVLFAAESRQAVMAGMQAMLWLNERLGEWLGEQNAADTLAQSVPHNVTAQMGLALLDVADRIRPHPQAVTFFETATDPGWLDDLRVIPGGSEASDAVRGFLDAYGARCIGEIDITRPRWDERPAALIPILLTNIRDFEPGEGERRFERGRQQALATRDTLLARLRQLPDGDDKATETEQMIDQLRGFAGYREYAKFAMVCRYRVHRRALLGEAQRLAAASVIDEIDDILYLTLDELRVVVRSQRSDRHLIAERRAAFAAYERLSAPRVITSDGEVFTGTYRRDGAPPGALIGLAVSSGIVEGRARVITNMADADLEPGDILVTTFTDPSWTPAFVSIAGLVTEVGGLMTHGSVIAREYGVPAVVGVEGATRLIRDGQHIRLDGTNGHVELL